MPLHQVRWPQGGGAVFVTLLGSSHDVACLERANGAKTFGDGLGNNEDADDDGDGFSDADELSVGTDPLNESSFPVVEEDTSGMPIWLYYITTQLDDAAMTSN